MSLPEPTQLELAERQNSYEAGYIMGLIEKEESLVKLFETRLCFDKYDCDDERCKTVMAFIALIKGESK